MTAWREFECPDCGALRNNQIWHSCPPEAQLVRLKAEVLELRQAVAGKAPEGFWGRAASRLIDDNKRLTVDLEVWKNLSHTQGLRAIDAEKKLGDIQSWKESVLAEVGEPKIIWSGGTAGVIAQQEENARHYKRRAEHLAAKLAIVRNALQLAFNHLDMHSLQISHCKDHAAITAALAGQPAPSAAQIDDAISGTRVDVAPLPLGGEQS